MREPKLLETLKKILSLERTEHDFQDRAVIGGLARYAETWLQQASRAFGPEAMPWVEEIARRLREYSTLPREKRPAALQEIFQLLDEGPERMPVTEPAIVPATPPETPAPEIAPAEPVQPSAAPSPEAKPAPAMAEAPPVLPRPPRPRPPKPAPPPPMEEPPGLKAPVTTIRGVGKKQAERLARLGIRTVRDILYFFPRRYDDYSNLKPINRLEYGEEVTVVARVWEAGKRESRSGMPIFKAILTDGTGFIEATWFNQPHLAERIRPGDMISVSGRVEEYLGHLCFNSPVWEPLDREMLHTGRIVPVYPLTEGIYPKWLREVIKRTVEYWAPRLPDHLPASVREPFGLLDLGLALRQVHFPDSKEMLERARYRLAFDELFVFQLGVLRQRHLWRSAPGRQLPVDREMLEAFIGSIPFPLTGAQRRALEHIVADLTSPHPMNRLLQGDVGSGKTVVAALAMALTVAAGAQAAMMAPTEILAEQHYQTLTRLFANFPGRPIQVALLTGSVTGAERRAVYAGLADGSIDVVVGTHALIQESVQFQNLALVVIDEQHRFGVRQRAALRQKGYNPHLLVMTATPIPRSLQLTLWGHLDVSVIDEMPPGRQPVTTRVIMPRERERAYAFVRSQVAKGRQAFIICPLVEESEKLEAKAAVEEYERLRRDIFPDLRLGLLHGRMKSEEKEATMAAFARGELDILVATSVVEVGIDVPNATVMLIEGAERFGLAQLHQFRGRVGRGEHPSYCLLVAESASPEAEERLKTVESTTDGFVLAQKDLELRGPGEFLGTRQSGMPDLKMASLADLRLLERVREAAQRVLEEDPNLEWPEHRLLARQMEELWASGEGEVS
ncbi:MAG: ATP-dependent DNA helicase RecG [Anaerolineae bacterium]|nr:ATP-dependent DNA helicase RecG [Anaerolineae bacterium]MDW7991130.1 ATP-dependent DNA helicase RecG [Anaerolineae bacterium]